MSMKDGQGWRSSKETWLIHKRLVACIKRAAKHQREQEPCGLVDLNSYIAGVGFYACHFPRGHEGKCATSPNSKPTGEMFLRERQR